MPRAHHDDSASSNGNILDKSDPKAQARDFGIGFRPKTKHINITPKWSAPSMIMIQCDINEQRASLLPTTISTLTGCHFGHPRQARMYKQDQVVTWRGAPHGTTLCYKCRNRLTYEINTADHPLVTTPSVPPSVVKLLGPCALGHRTSSSQGAFGETVWHQVREGRKWKSARAGDTLCFACFQQMRRCKQPQETEASDDEDESLVDQYFKRIKTMLPSSLKLITIKPCPFSPLSFPLLRVIC